jgi:mannose-6-phosphate isomerase
MIHLKPSVIIGQKDGILNKERLLLIGTERDFIKGVRLSVDDKKYRICPINSRTQQTRSGPMNQMCPMENPIQDYAWGSRYYIPRLLGEPSPSDRPYAELWMGAHPKAPSSVLFKGRWNPLHDLIQESPEEILGPSVARKFSNHLPFLFKVLGISKPLSIQAHPNKRQAEEGFTREDRCNIPLNAGHRNYRDTNHKPELFCALTISWALKGFRRLEDMTALLEETAGSCAGDILRPLKERPTSEGLRDFFHSLLTLKDRRKEEMLSNVLGICEKCCHGEPICEWILRLNQSYPGDVGILFPLLMNLVKLEPGEAIMTRPGELHAYLDGAGIELMANSDNVLRGALTSKHRDIPELLKILDFRCEPLEVLRPMKKGRHESSYSSTAKEFRLSVISLGEGDCFEGPEKRSVEILLCKEGAALIRDLKGDERHRLSEGRSILIPASVQGYLIEGRATVYKAAVPGI